MCLLETSGHLHRVLHLFLGAVSEEVENQETLGKQEQDTPHLQHPTLELQHDDPARLDRHPVKETIRRCKEHRSNAFAERTQLH
eukprot:Skav229033  [mRNA]  locus=scaffold1014:68029:72683:- [translate_table: standard]